MAGTKGLTAGLDLRPRALAWAIPFLVTWSAGSGFWSYTLTAARRLCIGGPRAVRDFDEPGAFPSAIGVLVLEGWWGPRRDAGEEALPGKTSY